MSISLGNNGLIVSNDCGEIMLGLAFDRVRSLPELRFTVLTGGASKHFGENIAPP